jgi:hypothetical protein
MSASAMTVNYDPQDFFGFGDVPFHRHLGLAFERRDGATVVALPAAVVDAGGEQATAAAYAVAEVSAALAACDTLAAIAPEFDPELRPVMLARVGRFRTLAPLRGRLESRTRFAGDAVEAIRRLAATNKAAVPIDVQILDGDGAPVAEARIDFYIRMMTERRLAAMTAAVERQTGGVR